MKDRTHLEKLDPQARDRLTRGELEGSLEAMLRTESPPSPAEQEALARAGWRTRTGVAQVLTGTVAGADQLEAVCRLPFVRQVELSRRLYDEPRGSSSGDEP